MMPRPSLPKPEKRTVAYFLAVDFANKLRTEQPQTNQNNREKVLVTIRFLVVRNYRRSCAMLTANPKSSPVTLSGSHGCKANRRGGKGAAPAARIVLVPESPTPARLEPGRRRGIRCRERLGGLLRYYSRAA